MSSVQSDLNYEIARELGRRLPELHGADGLNLNRVADVAIRVVLAAVTQRVEALPCSHTDSADLERVCRSCKAGRKRVDAGEVLTALDAPDE